MEILNHFKIAFLDGISAITTSIADLFQYFINIGIREETLILILVAAGISLLLLIAALLIAMSRIKIKTRAQRGDAPAKKSRKSREKKPKKGQTERVKGPNPAFAIFKKRKSASEAETSPTIVDELSSLTDVERDMLAVKELYDTGHISLEIYVDETKKLYEKAKSLA